VNFRITTLLISHQTPDLTPEVFLCGKLVFDSSITTFNAQ